MNDLNSVTISGFVEHMNYFQDGTAEMELYQNVGGKVLTRMFIRFGNSDPLLKEKIITDLRGIKIRKHDIILVQKASLYEEAGKLKLYVNSPGCVSMIERYKKDYGDITVEEFI